MTSIAEVIGFLFWRAYHMHEFYGSAQDKKCPGGLLFECKGIGIERIYICVNISTSAAARSQERYSDI